MVIGIGKKVALLSGNFLIGLTKTLMVIPRGTCRFQPSCSEYAFEALRTLPPHKAAYKILYRLIRCNPFAKGGYDPVH